MTKSNLAQVPEKLNYTEAEAIQALKSELEKGVESMERGSLYTIEEAWEEIDAI
ncbi:hypothetical protein [Lacrimispora sp.]|uniref:hypothetical protein n=1 Tax=Lacrimispora sp. TaxID=2719234 RepID=UPI00346067CD